MGLFDIFKKKKTGKVPPQPQPVIPQKPQPTQTDAIFKEHFQCCNPVKGARNTEICDKFVGRGIFEFSQNTFDEASLNDLNFDEFCHIYSTVDWFAQNFQISKENAVAYKLFLRKKLLARLSTFPTYTIYTTVNNLPFVIADGSMLLLSDKKLAEMVIKHTGHDWLKIHEITPESYNSCFAEYFCAGYQSVSINVETAVKIEDVYAVQPIARYGNICRDACTKMVDYKQSVAMVSSKAKKENRKPNSDELKALNLLSGLASTSLLNIPLLLPAETEAQQLKGIAVPLVSFSDGRKFIGLFTDQYAINGFYKKSISSVALPCLIRDQYEKCKNDPSISGIIINPGREEYMLTKEMLCQLLANV